MNFDLRTYGLLAAKLPCRGDLERRPLAGLQRTLHWLAAVLFCGASAAAIAQAIPEFYREPGLYPTRDYAAQHPNEFIDPFSGALSIQHEDVLLPGNGGFDPKVVRAYNSAAVRPEDPTKTLTWTAGLGWTMHFGRIVKPVSDAYFNNPVNSVDNPVLELPDGSRQLLSFTGFTSPMVLTNQRWRGDCILNGGGMRVFSPDGTQYEMTQRAVEIGGTGQVDAWYATRITDRNGNWASIAYLGPASPQITSVTTSDGCAIRFDYFDSGTLARRVSRITAAPG